ncbi:hypothetical protein B296_00014765, partial [Ensete ventricosum]
QAVGAETAGVEHDSTCYRRSRALLHVFYGEPIVLLGRGVSDDGGVMRALQFLQKLCKRSLYSSATETSGSRRGMRSGKLQWALRLLELGRATAWLTRRGLHRCFYMQQTEEDGRSQWAMTLRSSGQERLMAQRSAALAEEAEILYFLSHRTPTDA